METPDAAGAFAIGGIRTNSRDTSTNWRVRSAAGACRPLVLSAVPVTRFAALALLLCAACIPNRSGEQVQYNADLALTRLNLVDVENGRVLPEHTVLIAGDRIEAVGPSARVPVPPGAQVVQAQGRYLIPGLVDTHTHAHGWLDETESIPPLFRWFLANGVTTVRDASGMGREKTFVELRQKVERGEILTPRIYVSGTASVQNVGRHGAADLRDLTRRLIALGVDGIKIILLTRDEALAVLEEARLADVPVYGHTYVFGGDRMGRPDLTFGVDSYTLDVVRAGISGVMHVESTAPTPAHMPPPPTPQVQAENIVEWVLYWFTRWLHAEEAGVQALIDAMVAHGTWYEPTLSAYHVTAHPERYRQHPGEKYWGGSVHEFYGLPWFPEQDQPTIAAVMEAAMEFVRRFHEAGGSVIVGSDNLPLPGWGTHDELRLLVEAGLSPLAALQAATVNAARALRWENRIGTIEEGKVADLVLLGGNPLEDIRYAQNISALVVNGRYLDRQALDRLLQEAAESAPAR